MLDYLQIEVENRVNFACKRIEENERHDGMLSWYYGITYLVEFAEKTQIIVEERAKHYNALIEKAHDNYYDKAKNDFESVHKRIF